MRNIMDEVIGVYNTDCPDELLAKIKGYSRKKRSVMLDIVEFDNRKQKASGDFDLYLVVNSWTVLESIAWRGDGVHACIENVIIHIYQDILL